MATSKNYFLVLWAEDFDPEKGMEKPEYFVYWGFFITHLWAKRFVQSPKGEFFRGALVYGIIKKFLMPPIFLTGTEENSQKEIKIPKKRILILGSSSIKNRYLHKSQSSPNTY